MKCRVQSHAEPCNETARVYTAMPPGMRGRAIPAESTVRDYVSLQRGTTYKGNLVGKPGPALLGLGSIHPGGGFREADYKTYGGDCPEKLMLSPGDLFVSLKGATKDGEMIGSVARVPTTVPSGRLTQDTVKLVFHRSDADVEAFLYWLLRTPQYRRYCAGRATGSAVVALSREDFLSYLVPPLTPTRSSIVTLLEELDRKIELNRRMNETLEAMARALFKSWFVDFDPVRAKAEGRDTGLPAHIAALFPDSFEDSELGEIPGGWSIAAIRDVASNIQYGLTASAQTEGDGPKFLRITDIQGGRVDWSRVPRTNAPQAQLGRYRLKPHDILVARTGASTGENIYLPVVPEAVFASYLVRFQFGETALARFVGAFMRSSTYFEYVKNSIGGSAQPNASAQVLAGAKLVVPSRDLCRKYAEILAPIDQKIWRNRAESETLSVLRDTLLPKLVSGEIRLESDL